MKSSTTIEFRCSKIFQLTEQDNSFLIFLETNILNFVYYFIVIILTQAYFTEFLRFLLYSCNKSTDNILFFITSGIIIIVLNFLFPKLHVSCYIVCWIVPSLRKLFIQVMCNGRTSTTIVSSFNVLFAYEKYFYCIPV